MGCCMEDWTVGRHGGRGTGDERNGGGNRVVGVKDECDGYPIGVIPSLKPTPTSHLDLYSSSLHHLIMEEYSIVV
jgi:hypothetical protein